MHINVALNNTNNNIHILCTTDYKLSLRYHCNDQKSKYLIKNDFAKIILQNVDNILKNILIK